jgi:hypothetical protein
MTSVCANLEENILWQAATWKTKEEVENANKIYLGECSRMYFSDGGHCEMIFPINTLNFFVG